MPDTKPRVPALEGWFTMDARHPRLLGSRCRTCGDVCFPQERRFCHNPACAGTDFEAVPLSRTGTLWSFTNNCYQPPAPYVSPDPFRPYTIAAVELEREKMVVLGQVAPGVEPKDLRVGMKMELVLDTLFADEQNEYVVWKWKPVEAGC